MIHVQSPQWALLLLYFPVFLYLIHYAVKRKIETLKLFTGGSPSKENDFQLRGYRISSYLILFSLSFLTLALLRPSWNQQTRTVQKKGNEVVFLIDVSRSMLADDLIPNRLERAKLAVIDAVNTFDGEKVSLVAFAGSAVVKSPLTTDYGFFVDAVQRLQVDSVSKGGSLLGDSIRFTLNNVLKDSGSGDKELIIITDGEDQESYPVQAAEQADTMGVKILAIGLGDEKEGRRIPIDTESGTEFLTYKGKEVWTKLDAVTLRKVAGSTKGGKYLNVSTGTFDLAEIYKSISKGAEKTFNEEEKLTVYEERFQLFLLVAVLLLILSLFQPFRGWKHLISEKDHNILRRLWKK